MLKWLGRKLFGDFPPKSVSLCEQCRTALAVAGIIKPPISFDEMSAVLYEFGLLCRTPCGKGSFIKPDYLPLRHSSANILQQIPEKYGVECGRCRLSLTTMSCLVNDDYNFRRALPRMLDKELVCQSCLDKFMYNANNIAQEVISAVRNA